MKDSSFFSLTTALALALLTCMTVIPFYPFLLPRPRHAAIQAPSVPHAAGPKAAGPRVILFMLDGVGSRVAYQTRGMPKLKARLKEAAWGRAVATFPTLTPPGLRSILSGRRGLPEPEFPDLPLLSAEKDSVLREAKASGLGVVAVGQQNWISLFKDHGADMRIIRYQGPGPDYDAATFGAARDVILGRQGAWNFLAVHFFECDSLGHRYGTEGIEYRSQLARLDSYVAQLSILAGPETSILLTADHGQAPDGTHGGRDPLVTHVPLVIWGKGARRGWFGEVNLVDVAPTLAAMLGVMPPIQSEGFPVLAALTLTPEAKDRALIRTLRQKSSRWQDIKVDWPWLTGDPGTALGRAEKDLGAKHWGQASERAEEAINAVERAIELASPARWYGRFVVVQIIIAAACALAFLWGLDARASRPGAASALSLMAALLVPFFYQALWSWASLLCLAAAIAGLSAALAEGRRLPALPRHGVIAMAGLMALAFPMIVDTPLWAWIPLVAVCVVRRRWSAGWIVATLALAAGWVLGPTQPTGDSSLLRSMMPAWGPWLGRASPAAIEFFLISALTGVAWASLGGVARAGSRLVLTLVAMGPLILVAMETRLTGQPVSAAVFWPLIALSSFVMEYIFSGRQSRGLWLAIGGLAFHRALAGPGPGLRLALAVLIGWGFSREDRPRSPILATLEIAALGLWGFTMSGHRLDFAQIAIGSAERILGLGWHEQMLIAAVLLQLLLAMSAPVFPLLLSLSPSRVLAMLPVLGAISAGSLLAIWLDRFHSVRKNFNWAQDEFLARALWATVIAWVVTFWSLGRLAFDRLRVRARGYLVRKSLTSVDRR